MWHLDERLGSEAEFLNIESNASRTSCSGGLPPDVEAVLGKLCQTGNVENNSVATLFDRDKPMIAGRAPGRLDVMGGIADYSGSTVLQFPLKESTVVLCQCIEIPEFKVVSISQEQDAVAQTCYVPMSDFFNRNSEQPCSESTMHDYFKAQGDEHQWVAYVAGVLTVLMLHCRVRPTHGMVLVIQSSVPVGKGVSSSAALEVATMRAVCGLLGITLSAHRQAVLCQRVENLIVGAPCGLMDQMASSCGEEGALLNMLCQPDQVNDSVCLPDDLSVWGIDSGIRHAVTGADYGAVRVAAFMGYRFLLDMAGVAGQTVPAADINDQRWHGYLANVQVSEFMQRFYANLPEILTGEAFLERFDATTDTLTRVNAESHYAVRVCTAHPIHEHFRVRLFSRLANCVQQSADVDSIATLMGECMYQSHAGYSSCGLGCVECDDLVSRLSGLGVPHGIFGARITGGGSGGTVAILAKRSAESTIQRVAAEHAAYYGCGGYVFSGSSPGASVYPLTARDTA